MKLLISNLVSITRKFKLPIVIVLTENIVLVLYISLYLNVYKIDEEN
jgi:hypothetical protein